MALERRPVAVTPAPIPISRPLLGEPELDALRAPLADGWLTQGPRVAEFERLIAAFAGVPEAVATTSCTTALHVALTALGAGPGDEVVVPAFTWIATANAVLHTGATPVFCDVRLDTLNLDPDALAAAVTPRTVGLAPVHLFGKPAPMAAVTEIAHRHGLWVLEDAACALGAALDGVHPGRLGDAACLSFHPRKSITTGEGGMVLTADRGLAAKVRMLRDHGASRSDHARHGAANAFRMADFEAPGFNYRMSDLQGAVGCAQTGRLDGVLAERRRLARRYAGTLAELDWLALPREDPGEVHGWQAYVAVHADGTRRDALMAALEAEGIATRPGTHAPPATTAYRDRLGLEPGAFPVAEAAEARTLALPLFAGMTGAEQDRVIDALRRLGS